MRAPYAVVPVLIAAGLTISAAQDPAPAPFRTEANYVRVDMYPTANGAPVTDLLQTEVEILEDGTLQKIEQFEHVLVSGARPQTVRPDPANIDQARQAAGEPRARVFVLFLDVMHVPRGASVAIRKPLAAALNRIIGGDDLIAVMVPGMEARTLTFTRTTTSIENLLGTWWGERDRTGLADAVEESYAACYPGTPKADLATPVDQGVAQEMILRRRERQSLDALEDLVRHLRTVREERKAVITISSGWRLFEQNPQLGRPTESNQPATLGVGVDPASGRLATRDATGPKVASLACESDRLALSTIDHSLRFRTLLDEANRANTSFYTVDPRGLAPFDDDIYPAAAVGVNPTVSLAEEQSRLRDRNNSLKTMAEDTDGLAIVQTNQLAAGFERMAADLSSYYLMGYYSTQKTDGKFHRITVRIKRPGVQVRARRGYLAATTAAATVSSIAAPTEEADAQTQALQDSLATLRGFAKPQALRVQTVAGYAPSGTAAVWMIAEAERGVASATGDDWRSGGQLDITLLNEAGEAIASERVTLAAGVYSARVALRPTVSLAPGEYQVQIRGKSAVGSLALTAVTRTSVAAASGATGAIFSRRGATTGNRQVPTADLRFRRNEQLFLEIPTPSADVPVARLLDRTGKVIPIPVAAAIRDDPDGSRWRTAQLALAPLAPGDYVIEIIAGAERTLSAFRLSP